LAQAHHIFIYGSRTSVYSPSLHFCQSCQNQWNSGITFVNACVTLIHTAILRSPSAKQSNIIGPSLSKKVFLYAANLDAKSTSHFLYQMLTDFVNLQGFASPMVSTASFSCVVSWRRNEVQTEQKAVRCERHESRSLTSDCFLLHPHLSSAPTNSSRNMSSIGSC